MRRHGIRAGRQHLHRDRRRMVVSCGRARPGDPQDRRLVDADHMRTELPPAALMMATQRQKPAEGLICHSGRGSQCASEAYGRQRAAMTAKPSMSGTARRYDNAPIESFFHTLKVELVHQQRWSTREEARPDLFAYIEGYYNRRRTHSALTYRTPEQAERQMAQTWVHQIGGSSLPANHSNPSQQGRSPDRP